MEGGGVEINILMASQVAWRRHGDESGIHREKIRRQRDLLQDRV